MPINFIPPAKNIGWERIDMAGIFSRILYGGRVSLLVGFISVFGALLIGVPIGALAGYYSGIVDGILMRLVDVVISIPSFFLLLTLLTIFEPSLWKLILIFAVTSWDRHSQACAGRIFVFKESGVRLGIANDWNPSFENNF